MQQRLQRSNVNNIPSSSTVPPPAREDSVEASTVSESRLGGKKVKLPLFEGEDPVAWITRVE
ncbi:pentatricopeptide repeat-containing protein, partial [Trifolium medium]|nr:pentatricopeptide repeat-containing protein [Trifolium medium]